MKAKMGEQPDITITIVSWNTRQLLQECLRSILDKPVSSSLEVHVIDNASTDGSAAMVRDEFPQVCLTTNAENTGFARANNQSWRVARGRYWMLLNSDTVVKPGALDALVKFMDAHPRAGLATAKVVNPDGTPQFCAQPEPGIGLALLEASRLHKLLPQRRRGRLLLSTYWSYDEPARLGWAWGTALIARREAVEEAGPLAEDFFMYGEDLEWCLRVRRKGWDVWFCPDAEILHYGGQSSAQAWSDANRERIILDGIYSAIEQHRGRAYTGALHATRWLVANLENIRAKFRHGSPSYLTAPPEYHSEALKKIVRR
jgi:GT2 family glycosyltransferase